MKNLLCLLLFLTSSFSISQLTDTMFIDVDLGYRNKNRGYITNLTDKRFIIKHQVYYSDKTIKEMSKIGYKFVDTYALLGDYFPANHLLHSRKLDLQLYNSKFDSGLCHYDEFGREEFRPVSPNEVPNLKLYPISFDSLYKSKTLKDTLIVDPEINEIAYPFYMERLPISNWKFRRFYKYVVDSIAKEECYRKSVIAIRENSVHVSVKKTLELLNLSKPEIKQLLKNVNQIDFESLRKRGFSREKMDLNDREYMPFVADIYLPDYERFYKRREIDKRKICYRFQDLDGTWIETNMVYDSVNFVIGFTYSFVDPYTNMYQWHPAYDNFPIVNISLNQAKAYCHYMTKKLNEQNPLELYEYKVVLPSYYNYEWVLINHLKDKRVFFDPFFGRDLSDTINYFNPYIVELFEKEERGPFNSRKRTMPIMKTYWGDNYSGIYVGNNLVSEMTKDTLSDYFKTNLLDYWSYRTYLKSGHTRAQESIEGLKESGHLVLGGNWTYPEAQNYFGVNAIAVLKERYITPTEKNTKMGFSTVLYLIPKSASIETEK